MSTEFFSFFIYMFLDYLYRTSSISYTLILQEVEKLMIEVFGPARRLCLKLYVTIYNLLFHSYHWTKVLHEEGKS